jgi:hypothetical protein
MLTKVDFSHYMQQIGKNGITLIKSEPMKPTACTFDDVLDAVQEQKFKEEMAAKGIYVVTKEELKKTVKQEYTCPFGTMEGTILGRLGERRDAQYFNIKVSLSRFMAEKPDYTGMSDAEKYTAIYDRYKEAFGDFLPAGAISYVGDPQATTSQIWMQFGRELREVFGSYEAALRANKVAQYGNMSDSDIRAAIASKYPPMNKITLREFHEMTWEMCRVGVDNGLHEVLGSSTSWGYYSNNSVSSGLIREEMLDKPLDLKSLCDAYNGMLYAGSTTSAAGQVLRELFGVRFDARGNAYSNSPSPMNFEAYVKQWLASHKDWTAEDYENYFL